MPKRCDHTREGLTSVDLLVFLISKLIEKSTLLTLHEVPQPKNVERRAAEISLSPWRMNSSNATKWRSKENISDPFRRGVVRLISHIKPPQRPVYSSDLMWTTVRILCLYIGPIECGVILGIKTSTILAQEFLWQKRSTIISVGLYGARYRMLPLAFHRDNMHLICQVRHRLQVRSNDREKLWSFSLLKWGVPLFA